jgi:Spy/CpxP family protein refolding chaperone
MTHTLRRAAALLVLAALPGVAAATPRDREASGGRRHHGPPPIDRVLEEHAEELGLDAATLQRVEEIADVAHEQEQPLREALHDEREELRALLDQDAPDEESVMRQLEAIGAAETQLHKHRLRTLLTVRALLTPEQRKELLRIFEERRGRRADRARGPHPPE